jgi:hypothetical protein
MFLRSIIYTNKIIIALPMITYKKNVITILLLVSILFIACHKKVEEVSYMQHSCSGYAPFIKKLGLKDIAFASNDKKVMGILVYNNYQKANQSIYQDSSWKKAGWIGPLVTDPRGAVWCAPVPVINILHNKPEAQNNIYKINPQTGNMDVSVALPVTNTPTEENPYGILALAYNCEANCVYASSVLGSTRKEEHGVIYCISTIDNTVIDQLAWGDAFGVGISYKEGVRKLFFGSARTSDVYSIGIDEDGKFIGKPELAFSLQGLGARGDDKAKKIREDNQGNLIVSGFEFNFNLTAPTEIQETKYLFSWNEESKKWEYKNNSLQ